LTRNQPNVFIPPSRPSYRFPLVVSYRLSWTGIQQHQQYIKAMSTAKRSSTSKAAPKKSAAAKSAPSHPTWADMIKVCLFLLGHLPSCWSCNTRSCRVWLSCRLAALRQVKGLASVRTLSPAFSPLVALRHARSLLSSSVTHRRAPRSQRLFLHIGMYRRQRRSPRCLTPSNQEVCVLLGLLLYTPRLIL